MSISSSCVDTLRGRSWRTEHLHLDTSQFPCGCSSRKIMENWAPASGYIAVPVRMSFTEILSWLFACRHILYDETRERNLRENPCVSKLWTSLTAYWRFFCVGDVIVDLYIFVYLLSWIYMFCTMIQTDASYLFRTAYIHKNQYSAVGFYIRYIKS